MNTWKEDKRSSADAKHGRGYVIPSDESVQPRQNERRTSDDGLREAFAASLLGIWFALPIIKSVIRWMVYLAIICLALWFIP